MNVNEGKLFRHAHGEDINIGVAVDGSAVLIELQSEQRVKEMTEIIQRALNTWEPEKCPQWAVEFMDYVTGTPTQPERGAGYAGVTRPVQEVEHQVV